MTHDELLKRVQQLAVAWAKPNYNANALRAVVELHKPKPAGFDRYCLQCMENNGNGEIVNVSYPCRTIQAIEKELG